jgi:methylmalonyl-CoA epimerase
MSIVGLDHVGIAVSSLEEAIDRYGDLLEREARVVVEVPSQQIRVASFELGDQALELLESREEDSPVGRFLQKRGEGLHHVALRSDDIDADLQRLDDSFPCLHQEGAVVAPLSRRVGFIHPDGLHGVLGELVQPLEE